MKTKLGIVALASAMMLAACEDETKVEEGSGIKEVDFSKYDLASGKFADDIIQLSQDCISADCVVFVKPNDESEDLTINGKLIDGFPDHETTLASVFKGTLGTELNLVRTDSLTFAIASTNLTNIAKYSYSGYELGSLLSLAKEYTHFVISKPLLTEESRDKYNNPKVNEDATYFSTLIKDINGDTQGVYFEEETGFKTKAIVESMLVREEHVREGIYDFKMPEVSELLEEEFILEDLTKTVDMCQDITCTILVDNKDADTVLSYGYDLTSEEVYGKPVEFGMSFEEELNPSHNYFVGRGYVITADGGLEIIYLKEN